MARRHFRIIAVVFALLCAGPLVAQEKAKPFVLADIPAKRAHPDKTYHSDRWDTGPYLRKLLRIRAAEGNQAAAAKIPAAWQAFAKLAISKKINRRRALDSWGFWVWDEAQFGSGLNDPEWTLLLYKSIYDVAKTEKRFDWQMHVRSNLVSAYAHLCQWANARALLNDAEDYYKSIGFDIDPNKLPDQGNWDAKVPFVKKRDFPMMLPNGRAVVYWQRHETNWDASKPILIDNILTGLMQELANEDLAMGRWDRALERGTWLRRWSNAVNDFNVGKEGKKRARRENESTFQTSSGQMAYIMSILGFNEKALALIEDGLARKTANEKDKIGRVRLEIQKARYLVEHGKEDTALIARMDEALALEGKSQFVGIGGMDFARLVKARCLITLGKLDEAEALARTITAREQRKMRGWLAAELLLVDIMLERKQFTKAENTLRELMEALRITGVKIDELELYRAYVRWAFASGDWEAALRAQLEVMRLLEAFRMTPILPREQALLSRIMAELGDQEESDRLAALAREGGKGRDSRFVESIENHLRQRPDKGGATPPARVLAQPKRVVSVPLDGLPARAVISLINRGGREAKGMLRVKGLPAKISWDQAVGQGVVEVEEAPGDSVERVSEAIRIPAGTSVNFSCSGKLAGGAQRSVFLQWDGDGEGADACEWIIGTADKESDGAVIDAAEYADDPFFLIPIYHHLQSKGKDPVNLRVMTSLPCRVEMYDEAGALQMVDSEGNGSLAESGDWLGVDRDRNLAAEVLPDTTTGETRFLLQLDPKDWNGDEPLRIRVEWLVDGKWFLAAEDQIVSGK